jgi:ureidoglycolate hydrolase
MPKKILHFTHRNIKPYGYIIDSKCAKEQQDGNGWGILLNSRSTGWRIAYLILRKKKINRLECHPDSLETFEPVKGRAVIAIAASKSPKNFKLFYLSKPIVLKKGVWHGLYTISSQAHIKIFENIKVKCLYHS